MRALMVAVLLLAGCGGADGLQTEVAEVPLCAAVADVAACSGSGADGRICAICTGGSGAVVDCHAFRDAVAGTGVSGPAVTVDYHCVSGCKACE